MPLPVLDSIMYGHYVGWRQQRQSADNAAVMVQSAPLRQRAMIVAVAGSPHVLRSVSHSVLSPLWHLLGPAVHYSCQRPPCCAICPMVVKSAVCLIPSL
jgi:hypothetical protein